MRRRNPNTGRWVNISPEQQLILRHLPGTLDEMCDACPNFDRKQVSTLLGNLKQKGVIGLKDSVWIDLQPPSTRLPPEKLFPWCSDTRAILTHYIEKHSVTGRLELVGVFKELDSDMRDLYKWLRWAELTGEDPFT